MRGHRGCMRPLVPDKVLPGMEKFFASALHLSFPIFELVIEALTSTSQGMLREQLQASLDTNQQLLDTTKTQFRQDEARYQSDQHRRCHQAFKTSPYEKYKNINPDREKDTCQWVLTHPQYLQWKNNPNDDLLWISADPGCGKSVLAKSLVDHELQDTVCYFFFKDNEEQDCLDTALCALLHQLFAYQPHLIRHALTGWEKSGDQFKKEVDGMWRVLQNAAADSECHDVTCVLDALDECRDMDRRRLIDLLISFFVDKRSAPARQCGRLKFLVTSRPYDDIQARFQAIPPELPTIRLRGEDQNDDIRQEIDLVVRVRVTNLVSQFHLRPSSKEELLDKLLKMEHRTYLWLHLAIETIRETYRDSFRPDEEPIETLPSSVDDAYEKILSRVTNKQRDKVRQVLQIVVGSRRPLKVGEMALALGVATAKKYTCLADVQIDVGHLQQHIRQWCGLFVFINHSRIYLIHQTAKEFLVRESGGTALLHHQWKHCLEPVSTEASMTNICTNFLLLEDVGGSVDSPSIEWTEGNRPSFKPIGDVGSFLAYAAEHWPSHLRNTRIAKNDPVTSRILQLYDIGSMKFKLWFPVFWRTIRLEESEPTMSRIRLAALTGHHQIAHWIVEDELSSINMQDETGQSALTWASDQGHEKVVQVLLEAGADVNAQGGRNGSALQAASARGHEKVVQVLLEAGADVSAQGGFYGDALQAASSRGHEKVVQVLLEAGADVNAQGGHYGSALQAASGEGHEKVVQVLLEAGADVNAQSGFYGTALQAASLRGHEKVVQVLLEAGANINAQGGHYGSALQAASFGGYEKLVPFGGHEKLVQVLLGAGADVNAQGGEYGSALQAASARGHEKVVQVLLEAGANISTQGGHYGSALQTASSRGREKVVQVLLEAGADINAQGGRYGSALQVASSRGHEKAVQVLLEAGAEVKTQNQDGRTALHLAALNGHAEVVKLLIDQGAEVKTQDQDGQTALHLAAWNGYMKVVKLLIDQGAEVKTLHLAAQNGPTATGKWSSF
jgi:ankyrin repeat protein